MFGEENASMKIRSDCSLIARETLDHDVPKLLENCLQIINF